MRWGSPSLPSDTTHKEPGAACGRCAGGGGVRVGRGGQGEGRGMGRACEGGGGRDYNYDEMMMR